MSCNASLIKFNNFVLKENNKNIDVCCSYHMLRNSSFKELQTVLMQIL